MKILMIEMLVGKVWKPLMAKTNRDEARLALKLAQKINKENKFRLVPYDRVLPEPDGNWIPAKTKLPTIPKGKGQVAVLVWRLGFCEAVYYGKQHKAWGPCFFSPRFGKLEVTHWQYFPKGPAKNK